MNTIILWNPTIKKWVTLPLPRFECPDEYSQVLGFGYDPKTNDYKVVRLAYLNWEDSPKVELYSFRKGYWGSISSPLPPPDAIRYLSYPAFVNGAVNWLASEERMYCQLILSFSMEDELFCEIKLPESLVEEFMPDMCIDVFGESLALFHYDIRTTIEVCTIWVMKEYKVVESWTKLFNIVLGESLVFGIRRNSELLLATRDGKVTSYDPKTQQRNDIGLHGTPGSFCVHSYLPSLVLLDEANGVQGAQYVLEGSSEGTSSLGEEGGGNGENTDMEGSNKE
uniref:F-box associated beta-propeller type 1 domain-containing protein n=1 Tax=Davidia involucrata TaxID=16924 RepID=A0A5B7AAV4_DAVIN